VEKEIIYFYSFEIICYVSFPGLNPGDELAYLLKLMTSKNPDADIATWMVSKGGYNPCDDSSFFGDSSDSTTTPSTNSDVNECNSFFYPVLIQPSFYLLT
jgi:hypothetical protein